MSSIGRHVSKLTGYAPALPTPFGADGDIDIPAFERLCDLQLAHGATALIVCGTTGEAPTLIPEEHRLLIQIAAAQTRGRIPVIAGAGANATAHAIELTRDAEAAGADAVLSVVPYYNKPMQAGLYAHFRSLAESTGLPIILYDVPSRTACGLSDHTVARLAELPRIIGLKDAAGDAAGPPATPGRHEFPVAVRRGCPGFAVSRTRWRSVHFSNVKRCTRPLPQHVLGLETGPIGSCTASGASDCRTDDGAVPRDQSCSAQASSSAARSHVIVCSFAAGWIE
jgi:hypothetical protein